MRRKIAGVILAVSVFAGAFPGCSMFTAKDREAIGEKADTFISEMLKGRYERAARSVLDKDDDFMKSIPEDYRQLTIMEEVMYNSTYELGDIEVNKFDKEAACLFTVSYTDVIALTSSGDMPMADVLTAIDEGQEMTETELTVGFIYDDDDWAVDPDSAAELIEFFADMCEDLPLSGINEDSAIAYAEQFIGMIADGSFSESLDMTTIPYSDITSSLTLYYAEMDEEGIVSAIDEMQGAYFSTFDPTYTAERVDEYTYNVTVSGEIADIDAGLQSIVDDEDRFIPMLADMLAPMCVDEYYYEPDMNEFYSAYKDFYITGVSETTATVDKSISMEITCDDYGNFTIDVPEDDIFPPSVIQFYDILDNADDSTVFAACEILHDDGRMSEELFVEVISMYGETDLPDGMEVQDDPDDELYGQTVFFEDGTLYFCLETWDYYDAGDLFLYQLTLDGEPLVENGEYRMMTDYSDVIYISCDIGDTDELPIGTYELTVYEGNTDSTAPFGRVIVAPIGSEPSGGSVRFG